MTITLIVTRHLSLVAFLRECYPELAPEGTLVLTHVDDPAVLAGRHVVGVLPLHMAARAASITEIPLRLEAGDRGVELSLARLRSIAEPPVTYKVTIVDAVVLSPGPG